MKLFKETYSSVIILTVILIVVFVVMTIVNPERFLSMANLQSMAFQIPELGLFALAMFVAILSGGINLSIIGAANVAGIAGAVVLKSLVHGHGGVVLAIVASIAVILAVSLLVGLINGFLIGYAGVSAILATLATMTVLTGLSITITKGGAISGFPKPFLFIGNGDIFGVPMPFIIFIICAAVVALALRKSRLGFNMYMIGSNERATLFSGINNSVVLLKVYLLSGFLSGLAALVMVSRFNSAKASYGLSYLLLSVLVVLLGGASAYGGTGNVLGIVVALFLMQLFSSSFNLMGFSTFLTTAIWGMVLVFVMMVRGFMGSREG